jgi:hypothetical protein
MRIVSKLLIVFLCATLSVTAKANAGSRTIFELVPQLNMVQRTLGGVTYTTYYQSFTSSNAVAIMGGTITGSYTAAVTVVNYGSYGGLSAVVVSPRTFYYSGSTTPFYPYGTAYLSQYFTQETGDCWVKDSGGSNLFRFNFTLHISINGMIVNPNITSSFVINSVDYVP